MDSDTASVLLVEDEPDLAELYASWLEDAYRVETVGSEVAAGVVDDRIDVVVVDRRADSSVVELCDTIRSRDLETRVVILTGTEPDAADARFDDYILEPVSRAELQNSVEKQLLRRTYDDQLRTYFELVSQKAALDGRLSEAELQSSQEYAELEDRIAVLRTKINETRAQLLEQDDPQQLYREISTAPD